MLRQNLLQPYNSIKHITKEDFNYEIEKSISSGHSLQSTIILLTSLFGQKLGSYDLLYVEDKYVELLINFLLENVPQQIIKSVNFDNLLEFIDKLNTLSDLDHFCDFANEFYPKGGNKQLSSLKQLISKSSKVKSHNKLYLEQFVRQCYTLVHLKADYISGELDFNKCLIELLKYNKNPDQLCQKFGLYPELITHDDSSFKEFLQNLSTRSRSLCIYENRLQQSAKSIINQDNFALKKDVNRTIQSYLGKVVLKENHVDGRFLEVNGKHIVVSKELGQIESRLKISNSIEEVRFVNAGVVHIDVSLSDFVWRGKNLVLYAETVIVNDDKYVFWDVSGKDAAGFDEENKPGTSENGSGLNGADGQHGESGGNVLFIVGEVRNAQKLKIISNGGSGSTGQDGGRGSNGSDGIYLDEESFKTYFPPVSKLLDSKKFEHLEATRTSLLMNFQSVDTFFYGQTLLTCPMSKSEFEQNLSKCISKMQDFYCELRTSNGYKITLSFFYGNVVMESCQSLLLHEGALGEEGKRGGEGGRGGKGGYAGEITIRIDDTSTSNIALSMDAGKEGCRGKRGEDGNPGKKGADRAYADYSRGLTSKWPIYRIPNVKDDVRLCIQYFSDNGPERIYCAHKDKFAEIDCIKVEFTRKQRHGINANESAPSHHNIHLQRKKAIVEDSIRKQYQHKLYGTDLFKLNSFVEKVKLTVLDLIKNESLQTEQITTEINVVRPVRYSDHKNTIRHEDNSSTNEDILDGQYNDDQSVTACEVINLIKSNPTVLHNWKGLLNIRLNITQLQELWSIFNDIPLDENLNQYFNIVFCNKYHLAVLEQLNEFLITLHSNIISKAKCSKPEDYILSCSKNIFSISEEDAGIVGEYLLRNSRENRLEAICLFKDTFSSVAMNREILNNTLAGFVNGFRNDQLLKSKLVKLDEFNESKEKKLKLKLASFKNALSRSRNTNLYHMLIQSVTNQTNNDKILFENEIQKDSLLYILYRSYVKSAKDTFKCEALMEDQFLEKCVNTFYDNGPFCALYREFLAHQFETNIMIYGLNDNNEMFLAYNHNQTAAITEHFLMQGNSIKQLKIDSELCKLLDSQKTLGALLNDILIHTDSFVKKEQFDRFVTEKPFLSALYKGSGKFDSIRVRVTHSIMEEDHIKKVLSAYKMAKDKDLIQQRLEKLKMEHTGCESILYYMALHFENEGAHITSQELSIFINFVLQCALKIPHTIKMLSWIVAAYPQEHWLVEVILLKYELITGSAIDTSDRSKWRKYLCKQKERQILLLMVKKMSDKKTTLRKDVFEETLYLLSTIPKSHVGLDDFSLNDWKYQLKDKFWSCQLKPITDWSEDQLNLSSFYLVILENNIGTQMCMNVINILKKRNSDLVSDSSRKLVPGILRILTNNEVRLTDSLLQRLKGINICDWKDEIGNTCFSCSENRSLAEIIEIIKSTDSTSKNILNKVNAINEAITLSDKIKKALEGLENTKFDQWVSYMFLNKSKKRSVLDQIKEHIQSVNDELFVNVGKYLLQLFSSYNQLTNEQTNLKYDRLPNSSEEQTLYMMYAAVVTAVERTYQFEIRATQKIAIMTMLKSNGNLLSQISTGEGKSIIIVIVAVIKALRGQKVDIITSSHVLAERDAKKYKDVFNMFGIHVGHNCSENLEVRKQVYNKNVVYGDLANFQRDYLLDRVYNKNVFGDRSFEVIIIDEVDSMLLDKGNNTLYLSHEIPGLDKLQQVFVCIWIFLNTSNKQRNVEFNIPELKNNILNEIFGLVTKEDLRSLDCDLDNKEVNKTFNLLVKEGIISGNGKVLSTDCQVEAFKSISKNHLKYLLNKITGKEKKINIPNYLSQFVEAHIEEWIKSGIRAMLMEPEIDYVVDVDRSDTSCDRSPNITIIDRDTGTDLVNSQWEDGLHQFLQLKHGCRLSTLSLKAVFISNVKYLKQYEMLLGLTGTIGTIKEQQLLEEIYKVDFVTIPTAKTKLFMEEDPILCSTKEEWTGAIWESVFKKIKQNRSVLIICENVRDVIIVKQHLDPVNYALPPTNVHIYKRDYEDLTVARALEPGHVIISTNLAGRGTDIKLKEELVRAGGLHVCLSFLPSNSRIEEQAYGRAARNGEPGSAQIIHKNNVDENNKKIGIIDLKKHRDLDEVLRIEDIKKYNDSHVQPQECYFEEFCRLYQELRKSKHEEKIKDILLQISLDQWAFWLEKNKHSHDLKSNHDLMEPLMKLFGEDFINNIEDPSQLNKLGLILMDKKAYNQAFLLFDHVVNREPNFSENARYYRLCCEVSMKKVTTEEIVTELNLIVKLIQERIKSLLLSANMIDYIKKRNPMNILQMESFKEQCTNICEIYGVFLDHIFSVIGHGFRPEKLSLPTIIDEESASIIYNDLLREKVIAGPKLKNNVSVEDLEFSAMYGLLPSELLHILQYNDGYVMNEYELFKDIKYACILPSRELFWKELCDKKILLNEERYSIVDLQKLDNINPSYRSVFESLKISNNLENENQRWLYQLEEIDCFDEKELILIRKEELVEEIGVQTCKVLKHKFVIYQNKLATLTQPQDNIRLDYFDCLQTEDFLRVKISSDIALDIISELKEKHVIQEIAENKYSLSINAKDIASIRLDRFKAYSADVIQLLHVRFAFRHALETVLGLMNNNRKGEDCFYLPLQIRLEKRIIEDLWDHEVIKKATIIPNQENDVCKTLKRLYSNSITLEQLNTVLKELFDLETQRNNCIIDLIEGKVLSIVEQMNPVASVKYCIQLENLKNLSPRFQRYSKTIDLIFKRYLHLSGSQQQSYIKQFIDQHASNIHSIETPSISLKPLCDLLKEYKLPLRECSIFSLNGFDKLFVLEELRYSKYMMISSFVVGMISLTEITAGIALGAPHLVKQGLEDFNFLLGCLFSGHFSWKEYSVNKMTSMINTAFSFSSSGTNFKSTFGNFLRLLSMGGVTNRSTLKSVATEVLRYSVVQCGVQASYVAVENAINPIVEMFEKTLVERSISDVDETVKKHPVLDLVANLSEQMGNEMARKVIRLTSLAIMEDMRYKDDENFMILFGKLLHNFKNAFYLRKMHLDIKTMSWIELFKFLVNVKNMVEDAIDTIAHLKCALKEQQPKVTIDILDNIHNSLGKSCKSQSNIFETKSTLNDFQKEILNYWQQEIKNVHKFIINRCVTRPLKNQLISMVVGFLSQKNNKRFVSYLEEKGIRDFNIRQEFRGLENCNLPGKSDGIASFICTDYDAILTEMFVKNQSVSLFDEILKSSTTVDMVRQCCHVIPMALKSQGVNLPPLQIVIESNGGQQIIGESMESDVLTINIIPNENFLNNLKKNKIVLENIFDALYKAILQFYPELKEYDGQYIRTLVTKGIEKDHSILQHIFRDSRTKPKDSGESSEKDKDFLHYWERNESVYSSTEVDVRKKKSQELDKVGELVVKGFKCALDKIIEHLQLSHPYFKHLKLTLEDFEELEHEVIPSKQFSGSYFTSYAKKYELVIPLKIKKSDNLVDYNISMSLIRCPDRTKFHCPSSPHIVYKINPVNTCWNDNLDRESLLGFVLLDLECEKAVYGAGDCHYVG